MGQPRLIALGLENNVFSLLYVLTQGRIDDVPIADFWLAKRLSEIESNALLLLIKQIPSLVWILISSLAAILGG